MLVTYNNMYSLNSNLGPRYDIYLGTYLHL